MAACPNCTFPNRAEARFCGNCRVALTRTCPACSRDNRLAARFCAFCRTELFRSCPVCGFQNRPVAHFCQHCRAQMVVAPQVQPPTAQYQGALPTRLPVIASLSLPKHATGMLPPQTLVHNRYVILNKIAQGGMGAVYRATDAHLSGKFWAVKEMSESKIDPTERATAVANFQREGQLLASLRHDNLPQVVDIFEEDKRQFMVMEFVEGQTLGDYLDSQGNRALPEKEVVGWAGQLCDVLEYLHSLSPPIIYRDIKPDNVMIEQATGRLKLIDFGIVRFFKTGKTKDTMALGTPGYAPPEQFGSQTDARSDVYALAAMLHHLLTGRDPTGKKMFDFPPARTLNPSVSPEVEAALIKALKVSRDERPQSIAEFRTLLGLKPGQVQPKASVQPQSAAAPKPQPASSPPRPQSGMPSSQAALSTQKLDFGMVQLGQHATRTLQVHSAAGIAGKVSANQAWLQVSPNYLKGTSTDIDVRVDTSTLRLGPSTWQVPALVGMYWQRLEPAVRQFWWVLVVGALAGIAWPAVWLVVLAPFAMLALLAVIQGLIWWTFLHASRLVKDSAQHTGQIEVETGARTETVTVTLVVTPDPAETRWRWAAAAGLVSVELFAAFMIVASVLGM